MCLRLDSFIYIYSVCVCIHIVCVYIYTRLYCVYIYEVRSKPHLERRSITDNFSCGNTFPLLIKEEKLIQIFSSFMRSSSVSTTKMFRLVLLSVWDSKRFERLFYIYSHACTHAHTHTHTHTHVYIYIYIYIYTHAHTFIYIYSHKHTHRSDMNENLPYI